jgi:catechol 2,3-dioxygenase-like lactoylglutathione lyase family enzyme
MARAIGINHVALEVADVDEALAWYRQFFDFQLRGQHETMAWIDLGDQFIALSRAPPGEPDQARHFGLVVDDKQSLRSALLAAGVDINPGRGLRFRDPWGNNVEIVDYREIQFTKSPEVLSALAVGDIEKSGAALTELRQKGLA